MQKPLLVPQITNLICSVSTEGRCRQLSDRSEGADAGEVKIRDPGAGWARSVLQTGGDHFLPPLTYVSLFLMEPPGRWLFSEILYLLRVDSYLIIFRLQGLGSEVVLDLQSR